jgi:hypothetical protein
MNELERYPQILSQLVMHFTELPLLESAKIHFFITKRKPAQGTKNNMYVTEWVCVHLIGTCEVPSESKLSSRNNCKVMRSLKMEKLTKKNNESRRTNFIQSHF